MNITLLFIKNPIKYNDYIGKIELKYFVSSFFLNIGLNVYHIND